MIDAGKAGVAQVPLAEVVDRVSRISHSIQYRGRGRIALESVNETLPLRMQMIDVRRGHEDVAVARQRIVALPIAQDDENVGAFGHLGKRS